MLRYKFQFKWKEAKKEILVSLVFSILLFLASYLAYKISYRDDIHGWLATNNEVFHCEAWGKYEDLFINVFASFMIIGHVTFIGIRIFSDKTKLKFLPVYVASSGIFGFISLMIYISLIITGCE